MDLKNNKIVSKQHIPTLFSAMDLKSITTPNIQIDFDDEFDIAPSNI